MLARADDALTRNSAFAALRSDQSLSLTKARPVFWPWPAKLKPLTVNTRRDRACSSFRK